MTDKITVPRETWDAMREALRTITSLQTNDSATEWNMALIECDGALTAADAVSHPNPETAPPPEGGAITSESALALLVKEMRYISTITNGQAHRIAMMTLEKVAAANAVQPQGVADKSCINCKHDDIASSEMPCNQCFMHAGYPRWEPQAQGESYSERWYGSGEDRGWWIVRGGLVKREHVAFLGESVSPEEVSKVVAELNAAHPQASEPAGYKLVPVEPTPEMLVALVCTGLRNTFYEEGRARFMEEMAQGYGAMLAAAPEAKQ